MRPTTRPQTGGRRRARRRLIGALTLCLGTSLLTGFSLPSGAAPDPRPPRPKLPTFTGVASWYGEYFRGRTTACGEPYDPDALTAAHRTLPCWARVRVEHAGREVVVTITDRGPYVDGRVLDLSPAAFSELAPLETGLVGVRATILTP